MTYLCTTIPFTNYRQTMQFPKLMLFVFSLLLLGGCCNSICEDGFELDTIYFLGFDIKEVKSAYIFAETDGQPVGDTTYFVNGITTVGTDLYSVALGFAGDFNQTYRIGIQETGEMFTLRNVQTKVEECESNCMFNKGDAELEVLDSYELNGTTQIDNRIVIQR